MSSGRSCLRAIAWVEVTASAHLGCLWGSHPIWSPAGASHGLDLSGGQGWSPADKSWRSSPGTRSRWRRGGGGGGGGCLQEQTEPPAHCFASGTFLTQTQQSKWHAVPCPTTHCSSPKTKTMGPRCSPKPNAIPSVPTVSGHVGQHPPASWPMATPSQGSVILKWGCMSLSKSALAFHCLYLVP